MQGYGNSSLLQLESNPRKVIDGARRGVKHDLITLSNAWSEMAPELLKMDLLSVFYGHLDVSLIPTATHSSSSTRDTVNATPAVDRAYVSLIALTKLGKILVPPHLQISLPAIEEQTLNAWPGVYKWCMFFYSTRIAAGNNVIAGVCRTAMDVIGGVVYSLSRSEVVRAAIANTPGAVELATRTWIVEDECPAPSGMPIPVNSAALDALLTFPDWIPPVYEDRAFDAPRDAQAQEEDELEAQATEHAKSVRARLDRVVSAAGGNSSHVVELTFSRLRTATGVPTRIHEPRTAIILDLVGHLSRFPDHPFRLGFLYQGMTTFVTKLAIQIVSMLDVIAAAAGSGRKQIGFGSLGLGMQRSHPHQQGLLDSLVACLGFLSNTLESTDGFTWVAKAVSAGLLQAWTGAARHIHAFDSRKDVEMVIEIISKIVPRYLVYKSVVNLANGAVNKIQDDVRVDQWIYPPAIQVWKTFVSMVIDRYAIGLQMKALKSAACDNFVNCCNIDLKNNFMKCSGCNTTLYCLRECQRFAWREGGHKRVCKLKQQELLEGKSQSISKSDAAYFHHLATNEAKRNIPQLMNLAKSKYPALADSPTSLVITIDFLVYPPRLGLHPLAEQERYAPRLAPNISPNSESRNEELFQRARDNPGQFVMIQSKIANGQGIQSVQSIVPGIFFAENGWGQSCKY